MPRLSREGRAISLRSAFFKDGVRTPDDGLVQWDSLPLDTQQGWLNVLEKAEELDKQAPCAKGKVDW